MIVMLCRNRVEDYSKWRTVFDSHTDAHREAGLVLKDLWRDLDDPNDVHFVFEVGNLESAKAFIVDPESAKAGELSGVLDGEVRFLETADH